MRYFIVFSLIICFSSLAGAENYLRDLPKGHWAAEAVYELVRTGITGGYPDGTFRGGKKISRYEIASFLSKFAKSFKLRQGITEKLMEELKNEFSLIKYKRKKAEEETQFSGMIESRARYSTVAPRGGRVDSRLKMSLDKNFDPESSLRINLDTVDSGFNTDSLRSLTTKLLDIESKFKLGGFNFKVNVGPGRIYHSETDDLFPSENNLVYLRPKTAVEASTSAGKMDFSASYVARQAETSGKIGVHELTGKIGYDFDKLVVNFRPRYLFKLDGPRDMLAEIGMDYRPEKSWETNLLVSAGSFQAGQNGMYVKLIEKIKDPWKSGTNIVLRFDKVGSKYRQDNLDKYEFIYLNNFDRLILDGTADMGLKLNQRLSDQLSLEWISDYVATGDYQYGEAYAETYFLWQLGLSYAFSSQIGINAFYRSYNVPSGMAQFSDPVPKFSEILGFGMKASF